MSCKRRLVVAPGIHGRAGRLEDQNQKVSGLRGEVKPLNRVKPRYPARCLYSLSHRFFRPQVCYCKIILSPMLLFAFYVHCLPCLVHTLRILLLKYRSVVNILMFRLKHSRTKPFIERCDMHCQRWPSRNCVCRDKLDMMLIGICGCGS